MKINKWILSLVFALPLFLFFACNKGNHPDPSKENQQTKVALGEFAPQMVEAPKDGIVKVGFMQSARVFTLDMNSKNSTEYLKSLQSALENEVPVLIHVYEGTTEIAEVAAASKTGTEQYKKSISSSGAPVTKETLPIIPSQAALNSLFAAVNTSSIPFSYAVDGCYARAHKMRQIIIANGYECAKQFVYGSNLAARTPSGCCVQWSYHVAPLVRFKNAAGAVELSILDPSLFSGPVPLNTWLNKVKDATCVSSANVTSTALAYGNVYIRGANGSVMYDDNLAKTNCIISSYSGLSGCSTNPPASSGNCWPPYTP